MEQQPALKLRANGARADGSRQDLGRANRRRVLAELVFRGPVSRSAIAERTGLTNASVSRITRDLIEAGLVMERASVVNPNRPGRRFVELDIDGSGGYVLGIGLNVFQQSVTLADLKNNRIDRIDLSLADLSDPEVVIAEIVKAARRMIDTHVTDRNRLLGGGVAMTGAIDPVTGLVADVPYFGWRDVQLNLADRLTRDIGLPIHIENLANSINLAEVRFGAARTARNTLLVHCALGLGGSLYLDGQLIRGHDFGAGQVGNLPVSIADGDPRTLDDISGGRGILSAMGVSGIGVGSERADEIAARLMSAIDTANAGNPEAAAIMQRAGQTLGRFLAMFAGLIHPETILLSGPLPTAAPYLDACRETFEGHRLRDNNTIGLMRSDLSNQASARWLAIGEFMVNRDIELAPLKIEEAA
ncbi:MAG: ROK family transcriptional regulator [Rhodospirillaceae bacterium]|nr:ROK family transcriptional regulator [Rhodospirillaceae bacterium]MBT5299477.1 ROK family transcriptional regulator [Rhodospirillaceae bacterium]